VPKWKKVSASIRTGVEVNHFGTLPTEKGNHTLYYFNNRNMLQKLLFPTVSMSTYGLITLPITISKMDSIDFKLQTIVTRAFHTGKRTEKTVAIFTEFLVPCPVAFLPPLQRYGNQNTLQLIPHDDSIMKPDESDRKDPFISQLDQ